MTVAQGCITSKNVLSINLCKLHMLDLSGWASKGGFKFLLMYQVPNSSILALTSLINNLFNLLKNDASEYSSVSGNLELLSIMETSPYKVSQSAALPFSHSSRLLSPAFSSLYVYFRPKLQTIRAQIRLMLNWYPGSGVVLDCIDSWSLHPYLLCSLCFGDKISLACISKYLAHYKQMTFSGQNYSKDKG